MEYKVYYDFANEQIRLWPFIFPVIVFLLGLLVFLAGAFLRNVAEWKRVSNMFIGGLFCFFAVLCGIFSIRGNMSAFGASEEAYYGKKLINLEGNVGDFKPFADKNRQPESFVLNGQKFKYSALDQSYYGFKQDSAHGGPLKEGLKVRLAYFTDSEGRNIILKLEIPGRKDL